jgi:hypothetical protein
MTARLKPEGYRFANQSRRVVLGNVLWDNDVNVHHFLVDAEGKSEGSNAVASVPGSIEIKDDSPSLNFCECASWTTNSLLVDPCI